MSRKGAPRAPMCVMCQIIRVQDYWSRKSHLCLHCRREDRKSRVSLEEAVNPELEEILTESRGRKSAASIILDWMRA